MAIDKQTDLVCVSLSSSSGRRKSREETSEERLNSRRIFVSSEGCAMHSPVRVVEESRDDSGVVPAPAQARQSGHFGAGLAGW